MKFKHIAYLFLGLLFAMFSCNGDNTNNVSNSGDIYDLQISSFSVKARPHKKYTDQTVKEADSVKFRIFSNTKFAIDQIRGVIYNPDSLPYGLELRNVKMTVNYTNNGIVSEFKIAHPDTTEYSWNGSDSVNFSKTPINFEIFSVDGNIIPWKSKKYTLDIRIHQLDPDSIKWQRMGTLPVEEGEFKVLTIENNFYYFNYANNNIGLFTSSTDNINWFYHPVNGLPSGIDIQSIHFFNGDFYAVDENGNSYTSSDGENWRTLNNEKYITSIYGILPGQNRENDILLVSIQNGDNYYWGITTDMLDIMQIEKISGSTEKTIPRGFPLGKFSSVTNYSSSKNYNFLILAGGYDPANNELNSTWLIQRTNNGLAISSSVKQSFFKGSGLSAFLYNDHLYVLSDNKLYKSPSWGETWIPAPNKELPAIEVSDNSPKAATTDRNNNIWIFGGIFNSENNSILKGHMNKLPDN